MRYRMLCVLCCCMASTACSFSEFTQAIGTYNDYYAPSLHYTPLGGSEKWMITHPIQGVWVPAVKPEHCLPGYFSLNAVKQVADGNHDDYFFAQIATRGTTHLALWVRPLSNFSVKKTVLLVAGDWKDEVLTDNGEICAKKNYQAVALVFNAVDVEFDSGAVYFLKEGKKVSGTEFRGYPNNPQKTYAPARYNLASTEVIREKQPFRNKEMRLDLSEFSYLFPMTCVGLEGAVLVIDGLYKNGERLPPLKVQFNYNDFSRVPKP